MGKRTAGREQAPGSGPTAADRERLGPRLRTTVGGAVVLLLVAGAAAVLSFALNAPGGTRIVPAPQLPESAGTVEATHAGGGAAILVHVLGAVADPGLYQLADGERVVDAIAAAGGFAEKADRAALNLARAVADGEQVYIPAIGEAPPESAPGDPGHRLSLNTADAAELETLPGLGPELAGRIVEWREQNGPFTSVDDLLNVTGIGAKTVSGLAELVTT